jgi:hypothetical protein
MPSDTDEPQLAMLSPRKKPDLSRMLWEMKDALTRASNVGIWNRLQHNHFTRYLWWPGSSDDSLWSTRKVPQPGMKPPLPWPNSANLKVRVADTIINHYVDLLSVAESRTNPHILPADLDLGNQERMDKAAAWGAVYEYYAERSELELHRARSAWRDIAWEYGHSIIYVGWKREKQMEKRTLDADTVVQLLAFAFAGGKQAPPPGSPAESKAELIVYAGDYQDMLVTALRQIDPDMTLKEAKRVAPLLKKGQPVEYCAPVVVDEQPDVRAMIPGLHIFYPPETLNIQDAQFYVLPEWVSDVTMRDRVETEGWDSAAIENIIKVAAPGRATFFDSITFGTYMAQPISWALTGGMIGMGVQNGNMTGDKSCRMWQLLRVGYKATDPDTGVPVLYETIFHPDCPNDLVFHDYSIKDHARYPLADYKREEHAPGLWDSRGVGEISYSEQAELKEMADFAYNNAQITLRPPYEVSARSEMAAKDLGPGAKIVTSSAFGQGLKKIDIGGDPTPSTLVSQQAQNRAYGYFMMGMDPLMDPIAKQITQQARVNDYMKCAKRFMRLLFATIQQYVPEEVKAGAVNGQTQILDITRRDIQGNFSVFMEFDVMDLDPKSVEARAKMVREFIGPMDREGLLQLKPLLDVLMMTTFPKYGRAMVANPQDAQEQQITLANESLKNVLLGLEPDYRKLEGGNPALRKQVLQSHAMRPALDDKGQPIPGPDGRPLPGRVNEILRTFPDSLALYQNLIKAEDFQEAQQQNKEIGRTGVKPIQQGANGNS